MKRIQKAFCIVLAVMMTAGTMTFRADAASVKEMTAPSAVLMDAQSGKVLCCKNPHEVRPCASITKVMTLLLVMEALDSGKIRLGDMVTASEHAASMGGSDIWLEPGEQMSVHDMIKATVVASANDAAVALAEQVCGSEDAFVEKMNEKAASLGMKETVFKNCNGLDEDGHVTSAYDVAVMSRELIRHKKIFEYSGIWMDELRGGKTQIVNTNKLLKTYDGITGLKTGTTSKAGSCITATAERDGMSLIAVVLGSSSGKERFTDAAALLNYGFANYTMYTPKTPKEAVTDLPVTNGMSKNVRTAAFINDMFLIGKGAEQQVSYTVQLPKSVAAPVKKGDTVGYVIFRFGKEETGRYPIKAADDVKEIGFGDIFIRLLQSVFV